MHASFDDHKRADRRRTARASIRRKSGKSDPDTDINDAEDNKIVDEYFHHVLYFKQLREQSLLDTSDTRTTYDQALNTISYVINAIRAVEAPSKLIKTDVETAKVFMKTPDSPPVFVFRDPIAFQRLVTQSTSDYVRYLKRDFELTTVTDFATVFEDQDIDESDGWSGRSISTADVEQRLNQRSLANTIAGCAIDGEISNFRPPINCLDLTFPDANTLPDCLTAERFRLIQILDNRLRHERRGQVSSSGKISTVYEGPWDFCGCENFGLIG